MHPMFYIFIQPTGTSLGMIVLLTGPNRMLVHDNSLVHRNDGLWSWLSVAQSNMWSTDVVVFSPLLDYGWRLFQSAKILRIEAQRAVLR